MMTEEELSELAAKISDSIVEDALLWRVWMLNEKA